MRKRTGKIPKGRVTTIGDRRAVAVYTDVKDVIDGTVVLRFTNKISKDDFADGKVKPRAIGKRHKNQINTYISMSPECAKALQSLLDEMLP